MFQSLIKLSLPKWQQISVYSIRKCSKLSLSGNSTPRNVKKLGLFCGTVFAIPGVWYIQADSRQRRVARVTVQGIGRFLRYLAVILVQSLTYLVMPFYCKDLFQLD